MARFIKVTDSKSLTKHQLHVILHEVLFELQEPIDGFIVEDTPSEDMQAFSEKFALPVVKHAEVVPIQEVDCSKYKEIDILYLSIMDGEHSLCEYTRLTPYQKGYLEDLYNHLESIGVEKILEHITDRLFTTTNDIFRIGNNRVVFYFLYKHGYHIVIDDATHGEYYPITASREATIMLGYPTVLAQIVGNRIKAPIDVLNVDGVINNSDRWLDMLYGRDTHVKDGALLLYQHIAAGNHIVCVTDSDHDGTGAASIFDLAMHKYFNYENFTVVVNDRKYGNGVNDEMVKRILEIHSKTPVSLVVTADHGSADNERFKILKQNKMQIIVTDHHLIPNNTPPEHVDVFINPQHDDSRLPTYISGATVLYLLLIETYVTERPNRDDPYMREILPIVGATVLSDQMDLRKEINRWLVHTAIKIQSESPIVSLKAFHDGTWDTEIFSRGMGPIINAAGRMGTAHSAYLFMASKDTEQASSALATLKRLNLERRALQNKLTEIAEDQAKRISNKRLTKVIVLQDGEGVAGIIAGNIAEKYRRPTFVLVHNGTHIGGSGRTGVDNVNLEAIISRLRRLRDYVIKGGGHAAAAGIAINPDYLEEFIEDFEDEVQRQTGGVLKYDIYTDFKSPIKYLTNNLYNLLTELEPYGNSFPKPVIEIAAKVSKCVDRKTIGFGELKDPTGKISFITFDKNIMSRLKIGEHYIFKVYLKKSIRGGSIEAEILHADKF